ncbi:MAG: DUF6017 domain-containing protein [Oscillospiraceae bacterium]
MKNFTMLDNQIIDCETMPATLKIVYGAILRYTNSSNNTCYPSYQTIANKVNLSRLTVIKSVKKLVEAGLIKKNHRKNMLNKQEFTSNLYTVYAWDKSVEDYFNSNKKIKRNRRFLCENSAENKMENINSIPPLVYDIDRPSKNNILKQNTVNNTQFNVMMDKIKNNVDYDYLVFKYDNSKGMIDKIIDVAIKAICNQQNTQKINNKSIGQEEIKNCFLQMKKQHIEYILQAIKAKKRIKNLFAYLLTTIYNTITTNTTLENNSYSNSNTSYNAYNKSYSKQHQSYDLEELDRFWDTVPTLA